MKNTIEKMLTDVSVRDAETAKTALLSREGMIAWDGV